MSVPVTSPPETEYAPYYKGYISKVKDGGILNVLADQIENTVKFLRSFSEPDGDKRYAPDKWTVKQVVGHMIDTERVFAFRALWIARKDPSPLPGFEQDDWANMSDLSQVSLSELIHEFILVRQSTLTFFRHLSPDSWSSMGIANNYECTVRAIAYIIAGHELHHVDVLKRHYV